MAHFWQAIQMFFLSLGTKYRVNPWIFGAIYVGAIPCFSASLAWLVRNARQGKPTLLPLLSAGFFFVSAYLYLIVVGRNVPVWVYLFIAVMVLPGGYSAVKKVRKRMCR